MPSDGVPCFLFVAAVFFLYWTAAANRYARLGIILVANYFFCARFGLFYLLLLPACSTLDFLVGSASCAGNIRQSAGPWSGSA
jgi:hypothetical protein